MAYGNITNMERIQEARAQASEFEKNQAFMKGVSDGENSRPFKAIVKFKAEYKVGFDTGANMNKVN